MSILGRYMSSRRNDIFLVWSIFKLWSLFLKGLFPGSWSLDPSFSIPFMLSLGGILFNSRPYRRRQMFQVRIEFRFLLYLEKLASLFKDFLQPSSFFFFPPSRAFDAQVREIQWGNYRSKTLHYFCLLDLPWFIYTGLLRQFPLRSLIRILYLFQI